MRRSFCAPPCDGMPKCWTLVYARSPALAHHVSRVFSAGVVTRRGENSGSVVYGRAGLVLATRSALSLIRPRWFGSSDTERSKRRPRGRLENALLHTKPECCR